MITTRRKKGEIGEKVKREALQKHVERLVCCVITGKNERARERERKRG